MIMKDIARKLEENNSIALVIHVNADADCVGSAVALLKVLRSMDKKVHIFCDGDIPARLSFLINEDYFASEDVYDVCIAIDVAEKGMMGAMEDEIYNIAPVKCCLDHHSTNKGYADYNYIDPKASAAGEIVYAFIKDFLNQEITSDIAMHLYAAIASDTGSFKYSNTTERTHEIASKLIATGFDAPHVMRVLFERKTKEQLMLNSEVISNLEFHMEDKVCVAVVDEKMLSKYNLDFGEADDIASIPRSIVGVEVGVYIKLKGENDCKISLRSNEYVDVAAIAKSLGGGGHIRAAGVTVKDSPAKAKEIILDLIQKVI